MIKLKDLITERMDNQVFLPKWKFDPSKLPMGKLKITGDWMNKPIGAFWTSSWNMKTLSSGWADWTKSEMPDWNSGDGVVFEVKSVKLYTIKNEKDYEKLREKFPYESKNLYGDDFLDWKKISKKYDAVHVKNPYAHKALHCWDVESTAWFNMKPLKFIGTVAI